MPRPVLHITSVHNPRVAAVCALRKHRERDATGLFIAEGRREVPRAAAAGLRIVEVWHASDFMPEDDPDLAFVRERVGDGAAWYTASPTVFRKLAYLDDPHGLLAVVEQPRWDREGLGSGVWGLAEKSDNTAASTTPHAPRSAPLYLVAVGLAKPGNLGALARTAAAAGAAAMLVADGIVDAFNPNAIRASTGAVFVLPVVGDSSRNWLDWLQARQCAIVAATLDGGNLYAHPVDLTGPTAIVIGAEDTGLPDAWLAAATRRIFIPMATTGGYHVDSLNAAAAGAVLMFEAVRQRSCMDERQ